jgi:mRNA-degrading endonuclease toxin of MazEF toxin-antitoxin module
MNKDFWNWNKFKVNLNNKYQIPYFREREIWFCSLGINIGSEQDGKNLLFERPVLILKKFNSALFWGLPITSKIKTGKYYYIFNVGQAPKCCVLSQIRLMDAKRLSRKYMTLGLQQINEIKDALIGLIKDPPDIR